jgi:hypothetical protein
VDAFGPLFSGVSFRQLSTWPEAVYGP